MFKKIEAWIVGLIILFFIIVIIFISGVLRDSYLKKNHTPEILRNSLQFVAEIPKNIYHILKLTNVNKPHKLVKHQDKVRFKQFIENKRNALLILPRYDHSLSRSLVDIVDLNNFQILHTYKHDIEEMNDQIIDRDIIDRRNMDMRPLRFIYQHPLIFEDGSLISIYGPAYKIGFCSNLKWLNDENKFHHSQELDHEGNIWVGGNMYPKSKYLKKYSIELFEEDAIIKIDTNGKILYKKSVIEILIENNIVPNNFALTSSLLEKDPDPIHINDIEPALNDSEYWKKGDVFISVRNQNSVIHYRPSTNKVINYITGPFARQHDIDIISNKEISIFNNNNFLVNNKYSEVLIYNFETNKFRKLFNDQLQKENFKTISEGLSHIFKDGSLMVEEQNHGRIILFNNKGDKEWEFVNKDENGDINFVSWSRIIENDIFIDKLKSLVRNTECLN